MAIFRIEKNKNYTVMSNHHLKDKALTLRSKGLLSMILSLPDEWNYTTRGLAAICKEGVDCISASLRELETAGYLERNQLRDDRGRIADTEYIIYEFPQNKPDTPSPRVDSPYTENPYMDEPCTENTAQYNTNITKIKKESNIDLSNTHSIPIPSPFPSRMEMKGKESNINIFHKYREMICQNIDYGIMTGRNKSDKDRIDGIVDLMLETICTSKSTLRIAGDDYPAEVVKSKFLKLNSGHIEFVLECLKNNTTDIRNMKKYLLAVLFNAPSTMDSYYTSRVMYDMANGF